MIYPVTEHVCRSARHTTFYLASGPADVLVQADPIGQHDPERVDHQHQHRVRHQLLDSRVESQPATQPLPVGQSTVGGDAHLFRSVENYGNGLRLFGGNFSAISKDGHGRFFDSLIPELAQGRLLGGQDNRD